VQEIRRISAAETNEGEKRMKKQYVVYVEDPAGWDEEGPYSYKETFFGDDADAGEYVAPR
jgi:hypothetical protein